MGGTAEVWYGEHKITGAPRAVKILHERFCATEAASRDERDEIHKVRTRFMREGEALMEYPYPNVVRGYGLGRETATKRLCTVMEFLAGDDLLSAIRSRGRLDVARALRIGREIVEAVACMHEDGRIHRDLKCSNVILVGSDPETMTVKLIDFGTVSQPLDRRRTTRESITDRLGLECTYEYAPLEQIHQQRTSYNDKRVDVYALGVMLFQMLTGELPRRPWPHSPNLSVSDRRRMRGEFEASCANPPPVRGLAPAVPQDLADVIAQCLSPDRAKRHPSARHLAVALAKIHARYWTRCACGCHLRADRDQCPRCRTPIGEGGVLIVPGPARLVRTPLIYAWVLHVLALLTTLTVVGTAISDHPFEQLALPSQPMDFVFLALVVGAWLTLAYYLLIVPARIELGAPSAGKQSHSEAFREEAPHADEEESAPLADGAESDAQEPSEAPGVASGAHLVSHDQRRIPIRGPRMELGRANAVVPELRDAGLGEVHAVVHLLQDGSLRLEDTGQTSGTFLNGKKLVPRSIRPLVDGDRMTLGASAEFVVRISGSA